MDKFIAALTAILVTFLAGAAFWLSFGALHALANDNGIATPVLYPLVVDGFIIVASLAVLRGSLAGEKTLYPWLLVGVATIFSVVLNIAHAEATALGRVMSSVPPLALLLSFELLMSQLKATIKRARIVATLDKLKTAVSDMRGERDSLAGQLDKMTGQKEALAADIAQLKQDKREAESVTNGHLSTPLDTANDAKQDTIAERRAAVLDMVQDGMDKGDIADQLGVSYRTVTRDIKALNGQVTK